MSILKILTDSGRKLSDIYRTKGTVSGLDKLDTGQVVLTHDMGAEIASERLAYEVEAQSSLSVAQSTSTGLAIQIPFDNFGIVAVQPWTGDGQSGQLEWASVVLLNYNSVTTPIWHWNSTTGTAQTMYSKMVTAGTSADRDMLLPVWERAWPLWLPGRRDTQVTAAYRDVRGIIFRFESTAYGAGTMEVGCQVTYLHMADLIIDGTRRMRSKGLPPGAL